jgi:hypothetical protein
MDTDSLYFLIPAVIVVGAGCWLIAHIFSALHFSEPREFEYDGVMFWWIPQRRPSWFSKPHEYGRFEYEDGTRVEDARLHREIHEAWMLHNRPRSHN